MRIKLQYHLFRRTPALHGRSSRRCPVTRHSWNINKRIPRNPLTIQFTCHVFRYATDSSAYLSSYCWFLEYLTGNCVWNILQNSFLCTVPSNLFCCYFFIIYCYDVFRTYIIWFNVNKFFFWLLTFNIDVTF